MIGSVSFSGREEMYKSFKAKSKGDKEKFVIFDDENSIVWVCWCDEVMI